jgi:hypothetical protein
LEGVAREADIGKGFGDEIDDRADRAEKQDDEDPIVVGPTANEVEDRQSLKDEAPRIEKVAQQSHRHSSLASNFTSKR